MEILLILVTIISVGTAAVALTVAHRAAGAERRRSDARVAALAAAAVETETPGVSTTSLSRATSRLTETSGEDVSWPAEATHETLFETVRRPDEGPVRFGLAVGAVALVALTIVIFGLALRGGHSNASTPAVHAAPLLELVTLEHTQEMRALVITGMVRNPSAGAKLEGLTAVISLLDRQGMLIATKDVPLDYRALGPGEEAPFRLSLPDRGSIERYRVSFRAGTAIVPHVDRRNAALPESTNGAAHVTT